MEWFDKTALARVDFVHLRMQLQFLDPFELKSGMIMQLCRELKAARALLANISTQGTEPLLQRLLNPISNPDPRTRRAFPFYPSPFIIQHPGQLPLTLEVDDLFPLEVIFWGEGRQLISLFCRLVEILGQGGFHCGEGQFHVLRTEARVPGGGWCEMVMPEDLCAAPEVPILQAVDLIDDLQSVSRLEIFSPARLLVRGKPLFAPSSAAMLPFFLRRATGMCLAWCGVEIVPAPSELLDRFGNEKAPLAGLAWHDWRTLDKGYATQGLGGLLGVVPVPPSWSAELLPLFAIGQLLNLGKGAAYGGGAWRLC